MELNLGGGQTNQAPTLELSLALPTEATDYSAVIKASDGITEAELKQAEALVSQIDLNNSSLVIQYGAGAQTKMSKFSDQALQSTKAKDLGEVGDLITGLTTELRDFTTDGPPPKKGLFGIARKGMDKIASLKIRYETVGQNVDRIVKNLEEHRLQLIRDVQMLDGLYQQNLTYYKELTLYIYAGRKKLHEVEEGELKMLYEEAQASQTPEAAQKFKDLQDRCLSFDKKLHDLDLTRIISIQMGPQIRLVQSNSGMMVEKIHSTIVNVIPLWKNQMTLALGLANSAKAIEAQRAVTNATNSMLRKNADMLKTSTVAAAKESERAIVDIETLQHTNNQLISTLDEVLEIQRQGKEARALAQSELANIEGQLKTKLLEVRDVARAGSN